MILRRSLLLLALTGCSSAAKEERTLVLEELSSKVMLPGQRDLEQSASVLAEAVDAHCDAPDAERLQAARQSWRAARRAWRRTAAFQLGPSAELDLTSQLDFWPVRENDVEKAVAGAPPVSDAKYLASLGVSARGFPALEYLLFGPEAASQLAASATRCRYAAALARDVHARARGASEAWNTFADDLAHAGEAGSAVASTQAGIDLTLGSTTSALVALTDVTLGAPLGDKVGGTPQPDECESRYSGDSVEDYRAALASVKSVWVGAPSGEKGRGLTVLVRRHSVPFDDRLRARMGETDERLGALGEPICSAVLHDEPAVRAALDSARELRRLVTTDAVQVMGGTLGFSNNDGD